MESLEIVNQSTKTAYNKVAEMYDRLFHDELDKKVYDINFLDKFSKYFNSSSIICDAGCGPCGHVANYLFQKDLNVIGIDISEKCIQIAQNHFPSI